MQKEIERRFLVTGDAWRKDVASREELFQGYLHVGDEKAIRVRFASAGATLTIKAAISDVVRHEFEYAIPPDDARRLLDLCGSHRVEKIRHRLEYAGKIWEVDEFLGENAGLILAEIELECEEEEFAKPPWLDLEVTGDPRYSNAALALLPFGCWRERKGLSALS